MTDSKDRELPISAATFWLIAILLIVGVGAVIWFSIPGPDTRHDLRSPSGASLLQLGEECEAGVCRRAIIHERDSLRTGCPVDIPGGEPVFVTVTAKWNADETEVVLDYADAVGKAGKLVLMPARDCTQT